jgi:hypothetical protein
MYLSTQATGICGIFINRYEPIAGRTWIQTKLKLELKPSDADGQFISQS